MNDISDYIVLPHAADRYWERKAIGSPLIDKAIQDSYPYGKQLGNETYYRNDECKVVFVANHTKRIIKTTLTLEYAEANMQFLDRNRHLRKSRKTWKRRNWK